MSWSPSKYSAFEAERNRPIRDLLAELPAIRGARAVDLGCGPGNSTELLLAKYPDANVLGIDSAPAMIEAAKKRLPAARFEVGDLATWHTETPLDVVLANASLQWVGDHEGLLPRLVASLASGGVLAVQMPDNLDEPAHRAMRDVAATGPWAAALAGATKARAERHTPDWYYRVLRATGAAVDVWRTTYHHPLAGGAKAVVAWFESTGLRPFLAPLSDDERPRFLAAYEAAVTEAYPALDDGTVLLPFPRLFFVARS